MKLSLFVVCMAFVVIAFGSPHSAVSAPDSLQDQIVKLEQDWLAAEASGNMAPLRRLIADDFIGTGPGGNVLNKGDIVPESGEENRLPKSTLRDSTVRIFGDTAVLMGYVATDGATPPTGFHVTSVYQKQAAGWRMIATHMAR
jgi:ketosteroid isomerase-like protein